MPGTIATAYVEVLPSTEGITSNLEDAFGGAGDKAGKKGGLLAGKSFIRKIGKTLAAAGITKAITDFFKTAINQGAALQQNLGGTEAVFGEYAKSVQTSAKDAYKNMGLSASDYMATANKMGALFQGSGMAQVEAMQLSTQAMQRAADVASVMGIETSAAMEAVAGAAKGNFTMMDNLGVAMNATTLQAYALEKGINFDWNTASQAEKSRLAMEMFFDRTSQYAGNFAHESESTMSGSLGMLKASWADFMANLALGGDVRGTFKNLFNSIVTTGKNILPAIGNVFLGLWDVAKDAGKAIGSTLVGAFDNLKDTIKTKAPGLYSLLSQTWSMISKGAKAAWSGITNVVSDAWSGIKDFFGEHSGQLTESLGNIWTGIQQRWQGALDGLSSFWSTWGGTITAAASGVWDTIKVGFETALTFLTDVFSVFSSIFAGDWAGAWEGIKQLGTNAWNGIVNVFSTAWDGITSTAKAAWEVIGPYLSQKWDNIKTAAGNAFGKVASAVSNAWATIKGGVSTAWEAIKTAVQTAWEKITGINWSTVSSAVSGVWGSIKGALSGAWAAIKAAVQTAWNAITSINWGSVAGAVSGVWSSIKGSVSGAFDSIKKAVETAWEKISSIKLKLPSITLGALPKLPSIKITGSFSIFPPSAPKISWNAKAMENPYLFNSATLFGAGEVGDEVLYGRAALMRDIESAVGDAGSAGRMTALLEAIDRIDQHLDRLGVYLDGDTLVGSITDRMDNALGLRSLMTERGRA